MSSIEINNGSICSDGGFFLICDPLEVPLACAITLFECSDMQEFIDGAKVDSSRDRVKPAPDNGLICMAKNIRTGTAQGIQRESIYSINNDEWAVELLKGDSNIDGDTKDTRFSFGGFMPVWMSVKKIVIGEWELSYDIPKGTRPDKDDRISYDIIYTSRSGRIDDGTSISSNLRSIFPWLFNDEPAGEHRDVVERLLPFNGSEITELELISPPDVGNINPDTGEPDDSLDDYSFKVKVKQKGLAVGLSANEYRISAFSFDTDSQHVITAPGSTTVTNTVMPEKEYEFGGFNATEMIDMITNKVNLLPIPTATDDELNSDRNIMTIHINDFTSTIDTELEIDLVANQGESRYSIFRYAINRNHVTQDDSPTESQLTTDFQDAIIEDMKNVFDFREKPLGQLWGFFYPSDNENRNLRTLNLQSDGTPGDLTKEGDAWVIFLDVETEGPSLIYEKKIFTRRRFFNQWLLDRDSDPPTDTLHTEEATPFVGKTLIGSLGPRVIPGIVSAFGAPPGTDDVIGFGNLGILTKYDSEGFFSGTISVSIGANFGTEFFGQGSITAEEGGVIPQGFTGSKSKCGTNNFDLRDSNGEGRIANITASRTKINDSKSRRVINGFEEEVELVGSMGTDTEKPETGDITYTITDETEYIVMLPLNGTLDSNNVPPGVQDILDDFAGI